MMLNTEELIEWATENAKVKAIPIEWIKEQLQKEEYSWSKSYMFIAKRKPTKSRRLLWSYIKRLVERQYCGEQSYPPPRIT